MSTEGQPTAPPTTAQDAPSAVRRLLKSYDLAALRWNVSDDRYAIVVAILTRGNGEAQAWLRGVLSGDEIRELVRAYAGASCAEPERERLRQQLSLSSSDIPVRPYLGFRWGSGA
ncbi:MAG TPA: hypothetical protein VFG30_33730 [Polyangiales bacterium]|nr:hypothetical protein [Polyangiales bacterium]